MARFTAIVQITKASSRAGFNQQETPYTEGAMEMEGRLLWVPYEDLVKNFPADLKMLNPYRDGIKAENKTKCSIDIEFTETQTVPIDIPDDEEKPYIGAIQFRFFDEASNREPSELFARVRVTLPMSMFHYLLSMESKFITFETYPDLIENPNAEQKETQTIYYVRYAKFEISNDPRPQWKKH